MPPRFKFTKEDIIRNALLLTEEEGIESLTARGLAKRLGTSSKPIFGLFKNMNELQCAVKNSAYDLYSSYLNEGLADSTRPFYLTLGLAYIKFAMDKPNLFRLLFMTKPSEKRLSQAIIEIDNIVSMIEKVSGLSHEKAMLFHSEMWVCMHGIATTIVTNFRSWTMDEMETLLTLQFKGIKYSLEGDNDGSNQDSRLN